MPTTTCTPRQAWVRSHECVHVPTLVNQETCPKAKRAQDSVASLRPRNHPPFLCTYMWCGPRVHILYRCIQDFSREAREGSIREAQMEPLPSREGVSARFPR